MFNANDEDDLFSSTASSNLANLFGGTSIRNAQTDLKYTAPRQPKPTDFTSNENKADDIKTLERQKISVICAKVVVASKLANNSYVLVGKLGCALLGSDQTATEFLFYRDKQNIITKATISPSFDLSEEDNNLKFSDNAGVAWTMQFVNGEDHADFIRELTLRNVPITKLEQKLKPIVLSRSNLKKDVEENTSGDAQIRADILSRMARMGLSVLPAVKINETTESKMNDDEIEPKTEVEDPPQISTKEIQKSVPPIINQRPYTNPQIPAYYSTLHLTPQTSNDQDFRLFVSESRTHNSELRMNLTAISTKIDTALNEISKLKISPNTDKLENEFLKSKVSDLEQQLELRTNNDTMVKGWQDELKQLLLTNHNLKSELNDANEKLNEFDSYQKSEDSLRKEIEDLTGQLNEVNGKYNENQSKFLELEQLHENLMIENKTLHETNAKLTGDLNRERSKESISINIVKDTMNQMYQNILGDFEEDRNVSYKEIKSSLSKHMKQATFNIIDMLEN